MNFDLSDEQKLLAEQVRGLLAERTPYDHLRNLIDQHVEWDEPLWREFAEMGFLAVNIPEQFAGLGMRALDLGVMSEALGRANAALPYFSSIILCAGALTLAGSIAQKTEWLPKLASGNVVGCFVHGEGVSFENGALSGSSGPVADAGIAQIAVVSIDDSLMLVSLDQASVTRTKLDSFDQLRPHYALQFTQAKAEPLALQGMMPTLLDRAAVQAAFEAVGGAEACLYMARDFATERKIFGRTLASYQAIKHKLADIALATEFARSNAYFAGWAVDDAPDDLPVAAASARLTALSAFESAARENLQIHGGIGYTFAANPHFYYRRERTLALSLRPREDWADRLINHLPVRQTKAA